MQTIFNPAVPCFLPEAASVQGSQLADFIRHCRRVDEQELRDYADFQQFAIRDFRAFWRTFLAWSALLADGAADPVCRGDTVEHAVFFPALSLNYAENLLAGDDDLAAVIACQRGRRPTQLSRGQLRDRVQRAQAGLAGLGVGVGDHVVAIAYNDADAVVACLATAALGATFSTAAPDMGAPAILSRFGQLSPVVLVAHTEQRPGNQLRQSLADTIAGLPSLRGVVTLGESALPPLSDLPVHRLADLIEQAEPCATWTRFAFNLPLFILFSSGTTGAPKCIVHGAGGTLLEHLKEHRLHGDLRPGERLFFQTSCAWMMWNWQLSALACRATIVLYDGPVEGPATLWSVVAEHDVDVFGASPAYLKLCESAGYVPINQHVFPRLRAVLSTGSILYDAQYDWVLRDVKRVPVQSISGGTDIIGCFVLGNPALPVYRGEAQCRSLGLDVDAIGAEPGEVGELVCRNPFPSRPLGFFGDPDGVRFHAAYFSQHPGMWTHGDRVAFTPLGTARLHGRSDGVLNVRGMRIGSAEIYAALQDVPELLDVMAVEQELPDTPAGGRIVLLVVLAPAAALTRDLVLRLRRQIARRIAPAYVPGVIVDVAELPTTHSGKRSETAARDAINNRPVRNREALRNAVCLDAIAEHPGLHGGPTPVLAANSGQSTVDVLKAIWASAFGLDTIAAEADFFALGGDSLLAIAICAQIEQAFGYDLPIAALFDANTVASLAAVLDSGIVWQGDSPLVPLKEGVGRPVFLLHSISGNVFEWHALLGRLDCGRPLVAIQARGLNPAETPATSVEAMAADYVGLIRARQPDGPYTLMGYSFGGLLAYEVAARLSRMGETVEFLGQIDTDVQAGALPLSAWLRFRLARLLHFCHRTAGLQLVGTLRRGWEKVRHQPDKPEALQIARDNNGEAHLPPPLRRVRVACLRAFAVYDPPHYPGEVTFFRCPERRPYHCDPVIVWRRRAASVRVIGVPGSHETLMMEPNVGPLTAEIADCLRRVASRSAGNSYGSVLHAALAPRLAAPG